MEKMFLFSRQHMQTNSNHFVPPIDEIASKFCTGLFSHQLEKPNIEKRNSSVINIRGQTNSNHFMPLINGIALKFCTRS